MSTVMSSVGSRRNSSHVHVLGSVTTPPIEKRHSSSGIVGVGPADRTGNSVVAY